LDFFIKEVDVSLICFDFTMDPLDLDIEFTNFPLSIANSEHFRMNTLVYNIIDVL